MNKRDLSIGQVVLYKGQRHRVTTLRRARPGRVHIIPDDAWSPDLEASCLSVESDPTNTFTFIPGQEVDVTDLDSV